MSLSTYIAAKAKVGRRFGCSALYVRKVDNFAVLPLKKHKLAEGLAACFVEEIVITSFFFFFKHKVEERWVG